LFTKSILVAKPHYRSKPTAETQMKKRVKNEERERDKK
jgi:hypothetical protein